MPEGYWPLLWLFPHVTALQFARSVGGTFSSDASSHWLAIGLLKWLSTLYRNQRSLFFAPEPLDWSEQIVLITGGTFCKSMGFLEFSIINRIIWNGRTTSEYACGAQCKCGCSRHKANPNGKLCALDFISRVEHSSSSAPDNHITYYKCDVSKWEEVEAVSKKVIEEVNPLL